VQRAIFHNALEEPKTYDPDEILRLGYGRCGHVAVVLAKLLDGSAIENRIVKLMKHVVVEARWDGRWHILDGDLFKHGVVIRNERGAIPAIRDVQGNYLIDRFPPTAYVYTREYRLYREKASSLRPPNFFEPHEVPFMSYFYQMNSGLSAEYPPSRPHNLKSTIGIGKRVKLEWEESTDQDNDIVGYEVMIGSRSRGWNYCDPEYDNVPHDTSDKPIFTEDTSLSLDLDPGVYYWSVRAVDSHRKKEPLTYYFP